MAISHKTHNPRFLAFVQHAKSRVKEIDIEQYQKMPREGHLLVDVREDREWAEGHAAGAVHMSKGIIERDIETRVPDPATTMVLYCGGGYRSALVADALERMGYRNVISLDGGWRAWNEAGPPGAKD